MEEDQERPKLVIYGQSDDNIYVEGGRWSNQHGAWGRDEQSGTLTIVSTEGGAGGCTVKMSYVDPGIWKAEIGQLAEGAPIPWPVCVKTEPHLCPYSAVVEVQAHPDHIAVTYARGDE